MTWNMNPWVKELLLWHGQDRGGVHVPFLKGGNPLGTTISTNLISKLQEGAKSIAAGYAAAPRWFFLVGGPGNGKSEAVESFLATLDAALGMDDALIECFLDKLAAQPLVPRKVELLATDFAHSDGLFAERVGRLHVVQDATATDTATGNAALELADDIVALLEDTDTPTVFVVCVNRGLLVKALKEASESLTKTHPATRLLIALINATSLATGASTDPTKRLTCWPLSDYEQVACWPLDFESLAVEHGGDHSPVDQILSSATSVEKWEVPEACAGCEAAALCPFRQNAEWLRDNSTRRALISILRHGELFTGQRWNFRDVFSLVAELMVGQWSDFEPATHPCEWVHKQVRILQPAEKPHSTMSWADNQVSSAYLLFLRLYPHALFSTNWLRSAAEHYLSEENIPWPQGLVSRSVVEVIARGTSGSTKPIREVLAKHYARLDVATITPNESTHILRKVEDEYSQSIELGNSIERIPNLAEIEHIFLALLEIAEKEWDLLGRSSGQATRIIFLLRRMATTLVKRSLGVRLGHHSYEDYLRDYENCLHNAAGLNQVREALQALLGGTNFEFNMLESFGQPQDTRTQLVELNSRRPGIIAFPAPRGSATVPGHDVPSFEVDGAKGYQLPMTFDFYLALRLQRENCASSSLPASVRASIDRVRQRYAGVLARETRTFLNGTTNIYADGNYMLTLADDEANPIWTSR